MSSAATWTRLRQVRQRIRSKVWKIVNSGGSVASWTVRTALHGLHETISDQVAYSATLARWMETALLWLTFDAIAQRCQ